MIFKKTFILFSVIFCFKNLALANQADDQAFLIFQKSLEGALASPVQDYIKSQINSVIYVTVPVPNAPNDAGTTAFAVYSFGNATYDYIHANNDKQRFYAGAQATAAVLSVTAPPAGVILNVAILGSQLSEAVLGSAISEEIYQFQIKAQQDIAVINDIEKSFVAEDTATLKTVYAIYVRNRLALEKIESEIDQNNCRSSLGPKDLDQYENCVTYITQEVASLKTMLNLLNSFLNMPIVHLNKEKLFADKNVDINVLKNEILKLNDTLNSVEAKAGQLLKDYSSALFAYTNQKAQDDGLLEFKETFFDSCNKSTMNLIRKGALIGQFKANTPKEIVGLFGPLDKNSYVTEVQNFTDAQPCLTEADPTNKLYPQLLKNLALLETMTKNLEKN